MVDTPLWAYELSDAFVNPYSPQSISKESPFTVCGMMVDLDEKIK